MTGLDDLKQKFIIDEDLQHLNMMRLIEALIPICKIDKKGFVFVQDRSFTGGLKNKDFIHLILAVRFLGSHLQSSTEEEATICEVMNSDEIARMTGLKKEVVSARLKELKDEGKAISEKRGQYRASVYHLEQFIDSILKEKKEND